MNEIVRVIGGGPLGLSGVQRNMLRHWTAVLVQKGQGIADSEANALQQIQQLQRQRALSALAGNGVLSRLQIVNAPPFDPFAAFLWASSSVDGERLRVLVNGVVVELSGNADAAGLSVYMGEPPETGQRTDLAYVEIWWAEVQPTSAPEAASNQVYVRGNLQNGNRWPNDLVNVAWGRETSRRIQVRYRMMAEPGLNSLVGRRQQGYVWADAPEPGAYILGDGTEDAAKLLGTVDGYRYAIPLVLVSRYAGQTSIAAGEVVDIARLVRVWTNCDTVTGYHAAANPDAQGTSAEAGRLAVLTTNGKLNSATVNNYSGGGLTNAATLDGFDTRSATSSDIGTSAAANTLIPIGVDSKYTNAALKTGPGGGLDADLVDAKHASTTPAPNLLLALDTETKFPNSAWYIGTGNGLDIDMLDGLHASALAAAVHNHGNRMRVLGSQSYNQVSVFDSVQAYMGQFTDWPSAKCSFLFFYTVNFALEYPGTEKPYVELNTDIGNVAKAYGVQSTSRQTITAMWGGYSLNKRVIYFWLNTRNSPAPDWTIYGHAWRIVYWI